MASVQSGKMIVGLDIGTSKVVALVGEVTADGQLELASASVRRAHPSVDPRPTKKGVHSVVNPRHRGDRGGYRMPPRRSIPAVAIAGPADGRWPAGGRWHRYSSVPRPEEGRGGEHRVHRAVDPARHRRGPADGRLPYPLGVRRHRRQPHPQPQFPRHRGDPRSRGEPGGYRTGTGCRPGGGDPGGPAGAAYPGPGLRDR